MHIPKPVNGEVEGERGRAETKSVRETERVGGRGAGVASPCGSVNGLTGG